MTPVVVEPRGAQAPLFCGRISVLHASVLILALLPFYPGVFGSFVFDDFPNIVENPAFHAKLLSFRDWWEAVFSSTSSDLARPLGIFSLLLNTHFTGLDPFYLKLANLGLHGLNSVLLLALLNAVFDTPEAARAIRSRRLAPHALALVLATAWTVSAIHVSPILLVVQRIEILSHTFVLLALLVYVRTRNRQIAGEADGRVAILFALLVIPGLGILAKESAALTPVYALALEIYLFRGAAASVKSARALLLIFVLLAVAGIFLCVLMLPQFLLPESWVYRNFDLSERLLTQSRVLWSYARWIVLPDLGEMSLYHDAYRVSRGFWDPWTTGIAIAAWTLVLGTLMVLATRRSLFGLGLAWFLGAHLLTATFLPLELVFEHRNYFASIGLLLAVAAVVMRIAERTKAYRSAWWAVALLLGAQATVTTLRAFEWGDPLRLAVAEAARNPGSPRANYELGRVLLIWSGGSAGSPYFRPALERFRITSQLPGASILPFQALLVASSSAGEEIPDQWWADLRRKIETGRWIPDTVSGLRQLAICQIEARCHFEREQLEATLDAAIRHEPQNADAFSIYAFYAQVHLQDATRSEFLLRQAREIDPNNPIIWYQWGQALALLGRYADALEAADQIEALDRWHRHGSKAASLRILVEDLQKRPVPIVPPA